MMLGDLWFVMRALGEEHDDHHISATYQAGGGV